MADLPHDYDKVMRIVTKIFRPPEALLNRLTAREQQLLDKTFSQRDKHTAVLKEALECLRSKGDERLADRGEWALIGFTLVTHIIGALTQITASQSQLVKSQERSRLGKKTAAGNQRLMHAWHEYARKRQAGMEAVNQRLSAETLASNMLSSSKCKERKPTQRTLVEFVRKERKLKKAALAAEHSVYD